MGFTLMRGVMGILLGRSLGELRGRWRRGGLGWIIRTKMLLLRLNKAMYSPKPK